MFHCAPPTTDLPNYSSPQPLQSNLDVFLFTFDPQISTPTSFCRQKCLPGPTEIVQNEIASLAERLDQLLGKPQWEDRRVIKTRLQGSEDTIPNCLGELREIRESNGRAGIAADVHQADTPRVAGVERLRPRENGQRVSGGEWEGTD